MLKTLVRVTGGIFGISLRISIYATGTSAEAQDITKINSAVKYCVDAVHHFSANPTDAQFYGKFDAFYNSATGKVESNTVVVGDQAPLFQFNKCMVSKGVPLGTAPTAEAPPASKCTDAGLNQTPGDCWTKLSGWEKSLFMSASEVGWLYSYELAERQQYASRGDYFRDRDTNTLLPGNFDFNKIIKYFDDLYSTPENNTIWFSQAYDLAMRSHRASGKSLSAYLPLLLEMYRKHKLPFYGGYLQEFIPPNKIVVSRVSNSYTPKGAGDDRQTITLLGLSGNGESGDLAKFMQALLNIKECNTLIKLSDLYKYLSFKSDEGRDSAKQLEQSTYSPRLRVVIEYPLDSTGYEEFFNPKGELSGIVLLDNTQDVCMEEDGKKGLKIPNVKLGKIMVIGAKWEGQYGAYWMEGNSGDTFINLNEFLAANGFLKRDDLNTDPRLTAYLTRAVEGPAKEGVDKVLTIGGTGRSN